MGKEWKLRDRYELGYCDQVEFVRFFEKIQDLEYELVRLKHLKALVETKLEQAHEEIEYLFTKKKQLSSKQETKELQEAKTNE